MSSGRLINLAGKRERPTLKFHWYNRRTGSALIHWIPKVELGGEGGYNSYQQRKTRRHAKETARNAGAPVVTNSFVRRGS